MVVRSSAASSGVVSALTGDVSWESSASHHHHHHHHHHRHYAGHQQENSTTTLVSATLVPTAACSEGGSLTEANSLSIDPPPILAHAEPLWKRRRIVLCLSVWLLLAAAVIAVSVSLALSFTGKIGQYKRDNEDEESMSSNDGIASNVTTSSPTVAVAASSPTQAPIEMVPPRGVRIADHAVNWGKISTCDDPSFFSSQAYNLIIECGGVAQITGKVNAECRPVQLEGFGDDPSRFSCELQVFDGPVATDDGGYYQEADATVLFQCLGDSNADRTATVSLPAMFVEKCPREAFNSTRVRRALDEVSNLRPRHHARARAVEEVEKAGGAAAYISLGRFCRHDSDWRLWSELYLCEKGQHMLLTAIGDIWDGELPNVGDLGGLRRRRLIDLIDFVWDVVDLQSFCYNVNTCTADWPVSECLDDNTGSSACSDCSFKVPPILVSDHDGRQECSRRLSDEGPTDMWSLAEDQFEPFAFIDRVSELI